MDKSSITKAFNKTLFEFLDEIIVIVPENGDVKNTRMFLDMIRSANPALIIKLWFSSVYEPYVEQIENNDLSFFIDKNYVDDTQYLLNAKDVMQGIDKIRQPIREMSETNKAVSMKYLQKLSKLSQLYSTV